ncbi:hypothetical protein [Candidatus Pelagibacter sp. HIMB1509]|uniref:hypothetical protein n=1 Tax=Candidatus Pelagibacter sp. HIMB1509 TaxID=3413339 RepID=UPI003F87E0C2
MFKKILFFFLSLMLLTSSLNAQSITTLLRNQQLTVYDIGIFRLQEDMKSTIPQVQKHFPDKQIEIDDVYTDVVSSLWRNTIDLIVSVPMSETLTKTNYFSDMYRCKNIFFSVRDHLLRNQNESNYNFSRASSYVVSTFSTPTSWPSWKYEHKMIKELVSMIQLEVTLRPSNELAFKEGVSPINCKGSLADDFDTIVVTKNFN